MTVRQSDSCVDLVYPLRGSTIPQDHGYALYAAIVRVVGSIHSARDVGVFPIRGIPEARGKLRLTPDATLRVRVPTTKVPSMLPLAEQSLDLGGSALGVDVPRVAALVPAPLLSSSLVIIKLAHTTGHDVFVAPEAFLVAARKQLQAQGIRGEAHLQAIRRGSGSRPTTGSRVRRSSRPCHPRWWSSADALS